MCKNIWCNILSPTEFLHPQFIFPLHLKSDTFTGENTMIKINAQRRNKPASHLAVTLTACLLISTRGHVANFLQRKYEAINCSAAAHANQNYCSITACRVKTSELREPGMCACVQEQWERDSHCSLVRPGAQKKGRCSMWTWTLQRKCQISGSAHHIVWRFADAVPD